MSESAQVKSIDALLEFRTAFCRFGADASDALISVQLEARRVFDWLDDQLKFWQKEIHRRHEEVFQAKQELFRRKTSKFLDRTPDCSEQEMALEEAEARLEEAEDKVRACRRWGPELARAITEYEGPARQLSGTLETEFPRSVALLDRMIGALEAYVGLTASAGASGAGGVSRESKTPTAPATAGAATAAASQPPTAPGSPSEKPTEPNA